MGYFDEANKMYHHDNSRETGMFTNGRFAELRARWRINNMGWNYPIDYSSLEDNSLIAIVGDSFIEAFQVDVNNNYPYLLREMLIPEYEVYAFGMSGAGLSQYLNMSRYVKKKFDPDILIFNVVYNDFDESVYELDKGRSYFLQISIDDGLLSEIEPVPNYNFQQYNLLKRLVYKSALFRYIWHNLKFSFITWGNLIIDDFDVKKEFDRIREYEQLISQATDYIVKTIREENQDKRLIFLFAPPNEAVYDYFFDISRIEWLYNLMDETCQKYNVEYVDFTEVMRQDYQHNKRKFNSDVDGHWNDYGHKFVAEFLYDYLSDD